MSEQAVQARKTFGLRLRDLRLDANLNGRELAASSGMRSVMQVDPLDRDRFSDPDAVLGYLESRAAGRRLVLLDVGGYFASALAHVCARFSGELVGVVEDTENGHRRYAALEKIPCPVFGVARSPLKDPEDFLVGQSITFSAEALIRSWGDILNGRNAAVIGYGKLGRSIATMLHAKHVVVTVFDCDPVKRAQALSQGFRTSHTVRRAFRAMSSFFASRLVAMKIIPASIADR
jgi:adenosylhomocysteinase